MKRLAAMLALGLLSTAAHADMIEIKGKGVLNGKVVSQDASEVRFEDTRKNQFVVPRGDVLFLELQKEAPPATVSGPAPNPATKAASRRPGWQHRLKEWKERAASWFEKAVRAGRRSTKGLTDMVTKPVDRSDADAKAEVAAQALADATDSLRKTARKNKTQQTELRKAVRGDGAQSAKSEYGRKGTFGSLD
jgi:hypothetical protein